MLSFKMKDKNLTTTTDWEKIINDETSNAIYNKKLRALKELTATDDNTPAEYTNYFKNVKKQGKKLQQKQPYHIWTGLK
jgi:hypothetical protein